MNQKRIYFNEVQQRTFLIGAKTSVIVAGRRTGKTDSIASPFVLRNIQRMPGSTGGIVVPTFKHGLTNTIPGMIAAWQRWGYINGIHYVIGRRPPKTFKSAITEPAEYEHVISFYNGSRVVIISQDRPGSSNSLTLSWLLVDEAKFIDYSKLKDETLPANGGSKGFFGKHSFNHSIMILSDMPQTKKGSWFLNYEKEMDVELIKTIEATVYEIWRIKKQIREAQVPPEYLKYKIRTLDRQLNQMRSVAVYYKEYSSIENIQLLGEAFIKEMKRNLTPLTFQTSILSKKIGIVKDGFYSSMKEGHKYDASDFSVLDKMWTSQFTLKQNAEAMDMLADADVDPDTPICIGMDYNANINWIVAGQAVGKRLNVIKSFYVKYERKVQALIYDFCEYYRFMRKKQVIYYYDATARGSNYAVNEQDFHWVVVNEFRKYGWEVNDVYLGNPMKHAEKYLLINNGFMGKQRLMPFFNRQNNEDLILAIQAAGVSRGGAYGFKKDKGGEKLAENEEDLLEHRTDGTDAFDTLYIGCEKFPQSEFCIYDTGGVV